MRRFGRGRSGGSWWWRRRRWSSSGRRRCGRRGGCHLCTRRSKPEREHPNQQRSHRSTKGRDGGSTGGGRAHHGCNPRPARCRNPCAQRWCWGQEYVVRPPIVRRNNSAPSVGHVPPRWRDSCRSPIWEPPRRPSTRNVERIDFRNVAISSAFNEPAARAGSRPARHSVSSVSRLPRPAKRD